MVLQTKDIKNNLNTLGEGVFYKFQNIIKTINI